MIDCDSTLEDVVFAVASVLDRNDITAVLTGGSAAAIYAPKSVSSFDADFVLESTPEERLLDRALAEIGFTPSATIGMFQHPDSNFTIDFPRGPLAVGGDYIRETAIITRGTMRLRILTPTDCVRDRLSHFYHWNDYQALDAAVNVARAHRARVDIDALRQWTAREGTHPSQSFEEKFQDFLRRVG